MSNLDGRFTYAGFQLTVPGAPFEKFKNMRHAWITAKERGCDLTFPAFCIRLRKPGITWDKLVAPSKSSDKGAAIRKSRAKAKDEMHEICKELDERKAAIAASTPARNKP